MKFVIANLLIQILFVNYGICSICQNPPVINNFKVKETAGKWFLTAREINISDSVICPIITLTLLSDNVFHEEFKVKLVSDNSILTYTKDVKVIGNPAEGKIVISTSGPGTEGLSQVLDYDEHSHVLVYECDEEDQVETVHLITRNKSITPEFLKKINNILKSKLQGFTLVPTVQNC